jgi:hypothetical protein
MTEPRRRGATAAKQLEDLLEAYAEARLAPSGAVLARMRSALLSRAAADATARRAGSETTTPSTSHWALPGLHVPRRAFALGMAATLTLGTSAAVLAAPPGSPFYNTRVAIEIALLPSQADARLAAHEEHLAQRLADAQAAAARGDFASLGAALAAYRAEVDIALVDVGDDAALLAHLEEALARHMAVLTALEASVPDEAAIGQALASSQKAVEKIKAKGNHPAGPPTDTPGGPPDEAPNR